MFAPSEASHASVTLLQSVLQPSGGYLEVVVGGMRKRGRDIPMQKTTHRERLGTPPWRLV